MWLERRHAAARYSAMPDGMPALFLISRCRRDAASRQKRRRGRREERPPANRRWTARHLAVAGVAPGRKDIDDGMAREIF